MVQEAFVRLDAVAEETRGGVEVGATVVRQVLLEIVAVFAVGQPWQFKGWANIYSNPVELFQHVCGVHLMLDNDKAMDNIKSWSCKVLKINQFKRHLDVGAANDFWDMLDAFCKKKKTWVYKSSATYSSR